MSGEVTEAPAASASTERDVFGRIAAACAIGGGVLSLLLAVFVITSVAGRYFLGQPIDGDFEVVKMATAVGVFTFLPLAQWRRANIMVDTFTGQLPLGVQRRMDAFWDLVFAAFMLLMAISLARGTADYIMSGETMMQMPILIWPAILVCSVLSFLVAIIAVKTSAGLWRKP